MTEKPTPYILPLPEKVITASTIKDDDWDNPMTCPIDLKELAECEACN